MYELVLGLDWSSPPLDDQKYVSLDEVDISFLTSELFRLRVFALAFSIMVLFRVCKYVHVCTYRHT